MYKIILPAVAALGLVAFAAQSADRTPSAEPAMAWHLSHDGTIAKLAYGASNSDQLALMMTCMPGDATAAVYGDVQPTSARIATDAPAAPDPLSGGDAYETRISVRDAGLNRLADKGRLAVQGDGGTYQIAASVQERRIVGDFLSYCGSDRA